MTSLIISLNRNIFLILLISIIFFSFSLAYLSSITLNYFLMSQQERSLKIQDSRKRNISIPIPEKKPYEEYESILGGNLFQLSLGVGKEEENLALEVKEIELLGVLAGSPMFARALIKVKDENTIKEYAIGDIAGGNKILKIYGSSIVVLRGNRELEIFVGEDTSKAKEKEIQKSEQSEITSGDTKKITIKRSRVLQLTQNQAQLYENKFAPITKEGKILGIKMIFIPTNNFLYELGARSSDIIRRINGQPLDNMNKLMELWQNIQTLNKITVEIERGGKIIPFEIIIQD
jgi:general secretion pathway protein C